MNLTAILSPPDRPTVDALPLLADAGGIEVAVPWQGAPDLPEGTVLDVILESEVAAFRAAVVVQAHRPEDDALELRLGWVNPERVRLSMPGAVAEALSDATERFGNPVRARLDDGRAEPVGRLLDLTAEGVTLAVPTPRAPAEGATFTVRLDLPDGAPPAVPRARVHQSRPVGGESVITAVFVGAEGPRSRLADRLHALLAGKRSKRKQAGR